MHAPLETAALVRPAIEPWTPECLGMLRRSWAEGLSGAQVAQRINDEFGTHYSRSAVIGKAFRESLPSPATRNKGGSPFHGPKIPRERKRFSAKVKPPRYIEDATPREFLSITFDNLAKHHCRYPQGGYGAPIVYCGQKRMKGSSYCAACSHVSRWRRA